MPGQLVLASFKAANPRAIGHRSRQRDATYVDDIGDVDDLEHPLDDADDLLCGFNIWMSERLGRRSMMEWDHKNSDKSTQESKHFKWGQWGKDERRAMTLAKSTPIFMHFGFSRNSVSFCSSWSHWIQLKSSNAALPCNRKTYGCGSVDAIHSHITFIQDLFHNIHFATRQACPNTHRSVACRLGHRKCGEVHPRTYTTKDHDPQQDQNPTSPATWRHGETAKSKALFLFPGNNNLYNWAHWIWVQKRDDVQSDFIWFFP